MNFKELYQPVHTIIGEGCINEIPRHVDHFGGTKALIVTDEGLVKIGTVKMVTDVLTHAIEAYVANSRCPFTDGIALEAIRLIGKYLERAVKDGTDMEARTNMCWAQYMGGLAFSNAGLGMVHAMAHQLGGFYDTPHGVSNAILLPYVMKYNLPACPERYADVAQAFGFDIGGLTATQAAYAAILYIEELEKSIRIPKLSETAFKPEDVKTLSENAMKDTGMPENPRKATVEDVMRVFLNAYLEINE